MRNDKGGSSTGNTFVPRELAFAWTSLDKGREVQDGEPRGAKPTEAEPLIRALGECSKLPAPGFSRDAREASIRYLHDATENMSEIAASTGVRPQALGALGALEDSFAQEALYVVLYRSIRGYCSAWQGEHSESSCDVAAPWC